MMLWRIQAASQMHDMSLCVFTYLSYLIADSLSQGYDYGYIYLLDQLQNAAESPKSSVTEHSAAAVQGERGVKDILIIVTAM